MMALTDNPKYTGYTVGEHRLNEIIDHLERTYPDLTGLYDRAQIRSVLLESWEGEFPEVQIPFPCWLLTAKTQQQWIAYGDLEAICDRLSMRLMNAEPVPSGGKKSGRKEKVTR